MEDLQKELEEQREMASNRLAELDRLHQNHRDVLQQLEHLKMDIRQLPESVVVETTEYKCLQSQFSVLYNESMALKTQLDEARQQWHNAKNTHLRQIEQMESDELLRQKQLRSEVIQLEDMLAQVRKEYEMLRIEFEQQLAANEQTGPINREMRHLITSLQNHNQQLKGEVHRYRRSVKLSQFRNSGCFERDGPIGTICSLPEYICKQEVQGDKWRLVQDEKGAGGSPKQDPGFAGDPRRPRLARCCGFTRLCRKL